MFISSTVIKLSSLSRVWIFALVHILKRLLFTRQEKQTNKSLSRCLSVCLLVHLSGMPLPLFYCHFFSCCLLLSIYSSISHSVSLSTWTSYRLSVGLWVWSFVPTLVYFLWWRYRQSRGCFFFKKCFPSFLSFPSQTLWRHRIRRPCFCHQTPTGLCQAAETGKTSYLKVNSSFWGAKAAENIFK